MNGIFHVWQRETVLVVRNLNYLELPKIPLASFSAPLGIISGIALVNLFNVQKERSKGLRWRSLSILIFVGFTALTSLLAVLGGRSRYVLVPFASVFFLVILFHNETKTRVTSHHLIMLITIAAIFTTLTPNFIPDQYSFAMSAKMTDKTMFIISESIFEKLDSQFVVSRFQSKSNMRLYIVQEDEFRRSMGECGFITDKLVLRGIVPAKSYWDFIGRGPFDLLEEKYDYSTYSIVMDSRLVKVLALWLSR
ncbi:MAG: hypothetical protein QXU67_03385 [Candidatus Bathyarchaeia archaeon]